MAFSDPQRNIKELGISEGMRVADFGAGSGFYAIAAARAAGPDGKVYAIDVQQESLSHVKDLARKEHLGNVEVVRGDLEEIGGSQLGDGVADVVIASNILFQVEDKKIFLQEAWRVLKPKGRILVVDWKDSYGGMGPHPDQVVPERVARRLCDDVGFVFYKDVRAGDHHYGMVMHKPDKT